jgi:hypothetical protein
MADGRTAVEAAGGGANDSSGGMSGSNNNSRNERTRSSSLSNDNTGKQSIENAVSHLQKEAKPKSQNECAKFVRQALNAGGFDVKPTKHAKDYGSGLEKAGFKPVAAWDNASPDTLSADGYVTGYQPKAGDVVVIQPYKGGNSSGHMTMYDGKHWISDFKQRGMWPGPGYRKYRPSYTVYRHE